MTTLTVEDLTAEAFAEFGAVIDLPGTAAHASGPGWRWWAETALLPTDGRPYGVGYLDLEPAAPSFDWAERHLRTVETVVPLDAPCLVYVGPADHLDQPDRLAPLGQFRIFRVRPGQGVAMKPGVWHGAPLADGAPARALVLILEHTGRDDVTIVRFEDDPVTVTT